VTPRATGRAVGRHRRPRRARSPRGRQGRAACPRGVCPDDRFLAPTMGPVRAPEGQDPARPRAVLPGRPAVDPGRSPIHSALGRALPGLTGSASYRTVLPGPDPL